MNTITLTVPGHPVSKGRPRIVGNKKPHGITPDEVFVHENWIRQHAIAAMKTDPDTFPIDGPVELCVRFYFAWTATAIKQRRTHLIARPDLDNLLKCVKDGLALSQIFTDDARIVRYRDCEKLYGDPERTEIEMLVLQAVAKDPQQRTLLEVAGRAD